MVKFVEHCAGHLTRPGTLCFYQINKANMLAEQ